MHVDLDSAPRVAAWKAIGDPLRWAILRLLAAEELCVCHLVDELGVAQPLVSHHLGILRAAGLVESERWRYWTYYRLRPDALRHASGPLLELADATPAPDRRPCC